MSSPKTPIGTLAESETYPLGENNAHPDVANALALVTISHTPVEQRLYSAMLTQNSSDRVEFTARRLADITGMRSLSTIRRGLAGLVMKLSAQRSRPNGDGSRDRPVTYRAFQPSEVLQRRSQNSQGRVESHPNGNHAFQRAISRVAANLRLSRREAQVALWCAEGLTNADIGKRLEVSEQTVKFHLRHIFIKFGVKRRAELISRLLT
jgi:DNA-binding CsgD family transcriptional regulator